MSLVDIGVSDMRANKSGSAGYADFHDVVNKKTMSCKYPENKSRLFVITLEIIDKALVFVGLCVLFSFYFFLNDIR